MGDHLGYSAECPEGRDGPGGRRVGFVQERAPNIGQVALIECSLFLQQRARYHRLHENIEQFLLDTDEWTRPASCTT